MRVISGQGFETPVQVRSKFGPLHRVVLFKDGELCERMNCRNPEQLNITYQKFEDDDLEHSDRVFMQLYTSAKNDFEYSPMCKTAQAQIYAMLFDSELTECS